MSLADHVLDHGLVALGEADALFVCEGEPTSFTEASSTLALGCKVFGVGEGFGAAWSLPSTEREIAYSLLPPAF